MSGGEGGAFLLAQDYGKAWRVGAFCCLGTERAGHHADRPEEDRAEQEEQEGLGKQDCAEIAAGDDHGCAPQRKTACVGHYAISPAASSSSARAAASPAISTKASCRPARSIESDNMPAPPSISRFSSTSMPLSGTGKYQK